MPIELIAESHLKPSILAAADYLISAKALNIGLEIPHEWQYILRKRFPEYKKETPDIVFSTFTQLPCLAEYQRARSYEEKLEIMWPFHEENAPHIKLLRLR